MNFGDDGYVVEDMLAFTKVESEFYPQVGTLYRHRIRVWAAARQAEQGIERADDHLPATAPGADIGCPIPESPVFMTSCRVPQHSHARTEPLPGYRLLARAFVDRQGAGGGSPLRTLRVP